MSGSSSVSTMASIWPLVSWPSLFLDTVEMMAMNIVEGVVPRMKWRKVKSAMPATVVAVGPTKRRYLHSNNNDDADTQRNATQRKARTCTGRNMHQAWAVLVMMIVVVWEWEWW